MIFGGIQKNSFIDYPEKISCVLFLPRCNFQCPYCHNPQLLTEGKPAPDSLAETWVYDYLEKRKNFLDGVVISGGEPTLQVGLPAFCEKIKSMGYPVKLDTNGSRPEVLQRLMDDGLVDYIAMDIKTLPESYYPHLSAIDRPETIRLSIRRLMASGLDHEFRTTCVKPFITEDILERILELIQGADRFVLQQFQDSGILNPEFFHETDASYSVSELRRFQALSTPHVRVCSLRGVE